MFVVTHENDKHQGVAIEASKYQFADIETVINIIARNIDNKNDEANIFHGSESRENEENTTNEDNNKDCKDGEPSKNCKKNSNDKEKNKNSKKNFKNKKRDQKNDDSKNNESIKESDEDVITTGIVHDVSETQIAPQMMTLNKKISSIFFLDHVQDPHNVGNIIRSAFCFNVDAIILTERNACGITSAVVRSSAGYSECSLICKVNNTINAIEKLKKVGYLIIGFDSNATEKNKLDTIIGKYDKYVFIFGSEGDGMKDLTKKYCDFLVKLPMNPNAESLNVANTATIVGWEIMKHNADNDNSK